MKLTKRLLALALSGVLMLGGLTACGPQKADVSSSAPAQPGTVTADLTGRGDWTQREAVDLETLDSTTVTDLTEFLMGVPGDTTIATLNGEKITADELVYWIVAHCDSVQQSAYQSTGSLTIPWDADIGGGMTIQDFVRTESLNLAISQRLVAQKATEQGLKVTDEQMQLVQQTLDGIEAEGKSHLGATLDQYLGLSMALDQELFKLNNRCDFLYELLRDASFTGENAPTDEDVLTWLEEDEGYYRVKHILLATVDTATGQALPAEVVAEKHATAEALLAQLLAAEDPIALFDTLMKEYGEDPGVASQPDGYVAYPGQMVTEFEQASLGLEEGAFSDIVTSSYGYHIILRLPLDVDPAEYRDSYIMFAMSQLMAGWREASTVVVDEHYEALNVQELYDRMTAYRNNYPQPSAVTGE